MTHETENFDLQMTLEASEVVDLKRAVMGLMFASGAKGRKFESYRAYHKIKLKNVALASGFQPTVVCK